MPIKKRNSIKIHSRKEGRTTNNTKVLKLKKYTPSALKKAQKLLAKTDKYINNKGWLSSEESRFKKVRDAIYDLNQALIKDGYMSNERTKFGNSWVIVEYLSEISDAYPNWQNEYEELDNLIPKIFIGENFEPPKTNDLTLKDKVAQGIREATKDIVTDIDPVKECLDICNNENGSAWLFTEVMIQKLNALSFVIWNKWGSYEWADGDFVTENMIQSIYRNHDDKNLPTVLMSGFFRIQNIPDGGIKRMQKVYESSARLVVKRDPQANKNKIIEYLDNQNEIFIKGLGKYFNFN